MLQQRMPAVFAGHGSPMLAITDNDITRQFREAGERVLREAGRPRAILAVSAHWYTRGSLVADTRTPEQIYDMYGFPEALYDLQYRPAGSPEVARRVEALLGGAVTIDNTWGIDHGTWSVLTHMFPEADIPVLQLSVNGYLDAAGHYAAGEKLSALRDEDVLILGSGNIVHNLYRIEPGNPSGSPMAEGFQAKVVEAVEKRDDERVIDYKSLPFAHYAIPSPEHYLPLLYVLGATRSEKVTVFNNTCVSGSLGMAGFITG